MLPKEYRNVNMDIFLKFEYFHLIERRIVIEGSLEAYG